MSSDSKADASAQKDGTETVTGETQDALRRSIYSLMKQYNTNQKRLEPKFDQRMVVAWHANDCWCQTCWFQSQSDELDRDMTRK